MRWPAAVVTVLRAAMLLEEFIVQEALTEREKREAMRERTTLFFIMLTIWGVSIIVNTLYVVLYFSIRLLGVLLFRFTPL